MEVSGGKKCYVFASETCAFDLIGAVYLNEVEPGEMVSVGPEGLTRERYAPEQNRAHCVQTDPAQGSGAQTDLGDPTVACDQDLGSQSHLHVTGHGAHQATDAGQVRAHGVCGLHVRQPGRGRKQ